MVLSKKDYTIIKMAQATHPQRDFRCGTSMVYSDHKFLFCKLTLLVYGINLIWDKFNLNCILCKGDQLLKFI